MTESNNLPDTLEWSDQYFFTDQLEGIQMEYKETLSPSPAIITLK